MSYSDARERSHELRSTRRTRGARGGFTLIEVLAAVALLGILYAVLARVAIEGLRAEGDSERRLQASLIADTSVNQLFGAALPPFGHRETAAGDFTIALDVAPFVLPKEWGVGQDEEAPPLLLTSTPNSGVQVLRTVQITVSWLEGASERHVSRTTFLLDAQAVASLSAAAAPAGNAPANNTQNDSTNDSAPPPPPDSDEPTLPDSP